MFFTKINFILSAYLENLKPGGYFLTIKKTLNEVSGHSGKIF